MTEAHSFVLVDLTSCYCVTDDEGALWAFMLGLRQIFADFKKVEPNHAVFAAIEALLDARRSMWASAKTKTTQALAVMVDKYRDEGAGAEGADAEC